METPSPYSVAPVPKNEMARLRELDRYKVLDTPPEKKYDGITKAASLICSAPIALISLIDANRQWFKSKTGLDVSETPRDISFCQFAIQGQEILIVEDTSKDERFQKNPLVSGSPFIKFYAGAPLLTPSGIAVGTLCVLDTVPRGLDSKQLEALRALADSVVAYMELEANTRELIHAQAITLDLQKAREQFFVNMNHEFRTPVHGILGMVDLLHQTETNQIQSEYLDSVKESGEHLIRLINDVIDFSKAESGALVLSSIEFNLIELLKEIGILAVKEAEKKKLTFSLNLPKDLERLEVRSDAGRIRQVISNMISNALKFTESGKIDFSLENLSISETHVRGTLRFQDTGIGIAQERIPDLFEAFSQLDSSNSRKYGGTGLGLALSKKICNALGWKINVESRVGEGSNFLLEIVLPKASAESVSFPTKPKSNLPNTLDFSGYSTICILVAEDNPVNQKLIRKMLERMGLSCEVVSNGLEALAFWEKREIDLLLLDIQMPELSGLDTARILKLKPTSRKIPWIVAVTAHDSPEDREHCAKAGIDDYLGKPFRIEDLAEKIRQYLRTAYLPFPS
ncbi:response regulator receiver domain protein [Leptospira broomii serovar Hurstbridge str. 5399]|uniref:histidine kinase n=1 Tax=Leptospira broomii serovar Hurstbridge str. 5399 TaxID=1049789 RepID=T0F7N9_9LEPT|nr:response regulator receiver domain protein [Leptospira broomii serovar Hurstbridge str. 5399]